MTKLVSSRRALSLTVVSAAALTLVACVKPNQAPTTTPPPPPPATTAPSTTPPPPPPVGQAVLPGSEQDFVVNVGDRVYFDFDSFTVRADATSILESQAGWLTRYPSVRIRIEGNADERGTREYNLALGARRANSVRDFLVQRGVSADRITTISYGKERPIDESGTETAQQRNRNARTAIIGGAR